MIDYTDHYVAFLDILGFKTILDQYTCDQIYPIFNTLHSRSTSSKDVNGIEVEAYKYIKHMILSDSIIIFIKSDIDDAFAALIDVCKKLQRSLANRDNPILLRGGVAKGSLFHENDIIYGAGLTKAYLLESKLANFPRIIFSGDTLAQGELNARLMRHLLVGVPSLFRTDEDMLHYVNYMPTIGRMPASVEDQLYFTRIQNLCEKWLNREIETALREKYLWLKNTSQRTYNLW